MSLRSTEAAESTLPDPLRVCVLEAWAESKLAAGGEEGLEEFGVEEDLAVVAFGSSRRRTALTAIGAKTEEY